MQRLLLAEDDRDLRELLCTVLEADGATVVSVANGREALEMLENGGGDFDVALLDVRMPLMTGLEVLRESRRGGATVPIILITSFADHELVDRAIALGAACVLDKPIDADLLRRTVRGLREGPR